MCKFLFVLRHFHFATSQITHHFASPLRISVRVLPVRDFTVRTSRFTHSHKVSFKAKWVTKEVTKCRRLKNKAWKRYVKLKTIES